MVVRGSVVGIIDWNICKQVSDHLYRGGPDPASWRKPKMHRWPKRKNGRRPRHKTYRMIIGMLIGDWVFAEKKADMIYLHRKMIQFRGKGCLKCRRLENINGFVCTRIK